MNNELADLIRRIEMIEKTPLTIELREYRLMAERVDFLERRLSQLIGIIMRGTSMNDIDDLDTYLNDHHPFGKRLNAMEERIDFLHSRS